MQPCRSSHCDYLLEKINYITGAKRPEEESYLPLSAAEKSGLREECLSYYRKHVAELSSKEIIFLAQQPILKTATDIWEKKIKHCMDNSLQLDLDFINQYIRQPFNDQKKIALLSTAASKGCLSHVDLLDVRNDPVLLKLILKAKIKSAINSNEVESMDILQKFLATDPGYKHMSQYLKVAVTKNDWDQTKLLCQQDFSFASEALANASLQLAPKIKQLMIESYPQDILNSPNIFSMQEMDKFCRDLVQDKPDWILQRFNSQMNYHCPPQLTEPLIGLVVSRIQQGMPSEEVCLSILKLGDKLLDKLEQQLNLKDFFAQPTQMNLDDTVNAHNPDTEQRALSQNWFTRTLHLNMLQRLCLHSADNRSLLQDMTRHVQDNFALFNAPIKETINTIEYHINMLELAFKSSDYNKIFSFVSQVVDQLDNRQHQILASYVVRSSIEEATHKKPWLQDILQNVPASSFVFYKQALEHATKNREKFEDDEFLDEITKVINAYALDGLLENNTQAVKRRKI